MTDGHVDYRDALRVVCADLDHIVDEDMLDQLQADRLADKAAPFARIEDGILRMLRDLRRDGVKLGLISNCAPEEVAAWAASPLPEHFDDAIFSYDVGCAKPDVRIYRLACERLGVAPGRAMFVGDGGGNELVGAAHAELDPYQATWFLDRWPAWKRALPGYEAATNYPALQAPADVLAVAALRSRA